MIAACEEAGVPLFVAYYRRGLPKFLEIKRLLDSGAIGEVRFGQSTYLQPMRDYQEGLEPWRIQPELSGGGLFVHLASHTLDILDYLIGPIGEVKGFASNQTGKQKVEDIVTTSYAFESGVMGVRTNENPSLMCMKSHQAGVLHYALGFRARRCHDRSRCRR
ncbi:1,5-anhydro-D-fructose reductase [compost metagenome]